eukprot:16978-Heterococcus_DN1.PRE.1
MAFMPQPAAHSSRPLFKLHVSASWLSDMHTFRRADNHYCIHLLHTLSVARPQSAKAEANQAVAEVLSDALPFIMDHTGETIVIKYGGHAMEDATASLQFAKDIVLLKSCGVNPVIVHGGGPQIAAMLARLDIETSFVEGLRVTDSDTVDVAEMVLCGKINKGIASSIKQAGGRAVGLSGKDDNLILAEKLQKVITDPGTGQSKMLDLGYVGEIKKVNTKVISDLVAAGIIPVIAPIGVDERGQTYNCNADTAAGAIAAALKANRLLLLTDVKGVLNKEGVLLEHSILVDAATLHTAHTPTT